MPETLRPPTLDRGWWPTIRRSDCWATENSGQCTLRALSAGPNRASWKSHETKPAMASAGMHQERRGQRLHSPADLIVIGTFLEKNSLYSGDSFKLFVYFIFLFAILQGRLSH